jgi:hypothetical protein
MEKESSSSWSLGNSTVSAPLASPGSTAYLGTRLTPPGLREASGSGDLDEDLELSWIEPHGSIPERNDARGVMNLCIGSHRRAP